MPSVRCILRGNELALLLHHTNRTGEQRCSKHGTLQMTATPISPCHHGQWSGKAEVVVYHHLEGVALTGPKVQANLWELSRPRSGQRLNGKLPENNMCSIMTEKKCN